MAAPGSVDLSDGFCRRCTSPSDTWCHSSWRSTAWRRRSWHFRMQPWSTSPPATPARLACAPSPGKTSPSVLLYFWFVLSHFQTDRSGLEGAVVLASPAARSHSICGTQSNSILSSSGSRSAEPAAASVCCWNAGPSQPSAAMWRSTLWRQLMVLPLRVRLRLSCCRQWAQSLPPSTTLLKLPRHAPPTIRTNQRRPLDDQQLQLPRLFPWAADGRR